MRGRRTVGEYHCDWPMQDSSPPGKGFENLWLEVRTRGLVCGDALVYFAEPGAPRHRMSFQNNACGEQTPPPC